MNPNGANSRKKTRSWTDYEDQRLLAGIHRFGTDNWLIVANFVGNGRTRAQCSQRWIRGLDPRICKDKWSKEDENTLLRLIDQYGTKSWTRIAQEMGNRSDVQCRYHYKQMKADNSEDQLPLKISSSGSVPVYLNLNQPLPQFNNQQKSRVELPSIHDLLNNNPVDQNSPNSNKELGNGTPQNVPKGIKSTLSNDGQSVPSNLPNNHNTNMQNNGLQFVQLNPDQIAQLQQQQQMQQLQLQHQQQMMMNRRPSGTYMQIQAGTPRANMSSNTSMPILPSFQSILNSVPRHH